MREWPKQVPVLTADDICLTHATDPENANRHNLFGWVYEVFGHWMFGCGKITHRKSYKILPFFTPHGTTTGGCYGDEIQPCATAEEHARAFNKLTAQLGYVVGNPESHKKKPRATPVKKGESQP